MHKIDVECLPKDIPDHIELDVTNLGVGDSIHAIDIKIENVTIITPEDVVIVTVAAPKVVAEDTAEGVAKDSAEPEVIGKSKTEEDKG